jgi:hypothetical protein
MLDRFQELFQMEVKELNEQCWLEKADYNTMNGLEKDVRSRLAHHVKDTCIAFIKQTIPLKNMLDERGSCIHLPS